MPELLQLLLIALLGSIVPLIGGVFFLYWSPFSKTIERFAIPFAAGALITVGFIGLLPEAVHFLGTTALWGVLAAFIGSFLVERLFFSFHHHDHEDHHHSKTGDKSISKKDQSAAQSSVGLVLLGDTIHNLIDGVAIGGAFLVNPGLALITAFSTFLHELPHEIGDFGILLKASWEKRNILLVNTLSASVTVLGAFAVQQFAFDGAVIGWLMAISAGIFIYLGSVDFLPNSFDHAEKNWPNMVALLLGVVILAAGFTIIPHSHDEAGHTHEVGEMHNHDKAHTDHDHDHDEDDHAKDEAEHDADLDYQADHHSDDEHAADHHEEEPHTEEDGHTHGHN